MAGKPVTVKMVGNVFVEQYYYILHRNPELAHRFYYNSSVLSRPEEDGSMTPVTTIEGINKRILSLDSTSYSVEILSVDAQASYNDGVMVVVIGCLTGKDNRKRKFAQSFFLAPQAKGYFVSDDIFKYVDEYKSDDVDSVPINNAYGSTPAYSEPVMAGEVSVQVVANAFVKQYYTTLQKNPELVHRFYHNSSVLSWPEEDGSMNPVTTIQGINKKILSGDSTSYRVEILSVDALHYYEKGAMVVVTGSLKGKDKWKKFIQSFFLAPQDVGFFVLNDVFRYVNESKSDDDFVLIKDDDGSTPASTTELSNSYTGIRKWADHAWRVMFEKFHSFKG
ncbi:hypothetical protein L6164_036283 [Bauhinia variegata]|uniref:Uncharacterized protein n=1 Tax=Bauhinia variegata TaxID=167791 RepID=A0ACB9KGR4_BAUVA|nr:hypothetical protein L6164_036283 [Bauhinia variegata]